MTMREKIARIIVAGNTPELWDAISPDSKQFWLERADAVFDALMQGTQEMFLAGHDARPDVIEIYQAMIRAAKDGK